MARTFLIGAVLTCASASGASALDILLTNDDGFEAPGIRALHTRLIADGHNVTMVAPNRNFSGSSASLTFAAVSVENTEPGVYAVDGSPATCTILGVTGILQARPDLVVSGINEGANLGPATPISGTVGATTAALRLFDTPIPAIAFSTDLIASGEEGDSATNKAHFNNVASYAARLIKKLEASVKGGKLLPSGIGLNVNYPPVQPTAIKGTALAQQGLKTFFALGYDDSDGDGTYLPVFGEADATGDRRLSDTLLFEDGYVTIVPTDGDFTAEAWASRWLRRAINGL